MNLSKIAAIATIVGGVVAVVALMQSCNQSEPTSVKNPPAQTEKGSQIASQVVRPSDIRPCTDKDYYQIGWKRSEQISGTSGWVGGGSDPTNWCNQLINSSIAGRSIGPEHEVKIINSSEEGKWTFPRKRKYNYHCTILLSWDPKYEKKADAVCK